MNAHAMQWNANAYICFCICYKYIFIRMLYVQCTCTHLCYTSNDLYINHTSAHTDRQTDTHTSGTVVLNNDRRVGRWFAVVVIAGATLCCRELARRLGGGWGLAACCWSHVGRTADVYPNGLLILSIWGLIFVFLLFQPLDSYYYCRFTLLILFFGISRTF